MRSILSKEPLKNPSKSRSITYSHTKDSRGAKQTSTQNKSIQRSSKTKPKLKEKQKNESTIVRRSVQDDKLRTIMSSTLNLIQSSTSIEISTRNKHQSSSRELINMAEDIHSLVSLMVRDKNVKRSQSFITDREKSLNKQYLSKYFQTKLSGDMKDEQAIEKRLRSMQAVKISRGIMSKYQSQSVEDSDFQKQNYESINQKRVLKNILSKRELNL